MLGGGRSCKLVCRLIKFPSWHFLTSLRYSFVLFGFSSLVLQCGPPHFLVVLLAMFVFYIIASSLLPATPGETFQVTDCFRCRGLL